jgi:hypothetical protein
MLDPESALISCPGPAEIAATCSSILAQLPPDVARRLRAVRNSYLIAYDWEGVFERLNGKTVARVLAEYREPDHEPVVASGEIEGVRYVLHGAPPPHGRTSGGGILGRLRRLWGAARGRPSARADRAERPRPAAPEGEPGRLKFRATQGGFRDERDSPFCLLCGVSGPDAAGAEHYLTFQRSFETGAPSEDDGVHCEFDHQRNGEFNCVSRCRLTRATLEVDLCGRRKRYTGVSVDVSALDSATFADIRRGLPRIFRGTEGILELAESSAAPGTLRE